MKIGHFRHQLKSKISRVMKRTGFWFWAYLKARVVSFLVVPTNRMVDFFSLLDAAEAPWVVWVQSTKCLVPNNKWYYYWQYKWPWITLYYPSCRDRAGVFDATVIWADVRSHGPGAKENTDEVLRHVTVSCCRKIGAEWEPGLPDDQTQSSWD